MVKFSTILLSTLPPKLLSPMFSSDPAATPSASTASFPSSTSSSRISSCPRLFPPAPRRHFLLLVPLRALSGPLGRSSDCHLLAELCVTELEVSGSRLPACFSGFLILYIAFREARPGVLVPAGLSILKVLVFRHLGRRSEACDGLREECARWLLYLCVLELDNRRLLALFFLVRYRRILSTKLSFSFLISLAAYCCYLYVLARKWLNF